METNSPNKVSVYIVFRIRPFIPRNDSINTLGFGSRQRSNGKLSILLTPVLMIDADNVLVAIDQKPSFPFCILRMTVENRSNKFCIPGNEAEL